MTRAYYPSAVRCAITAMEKGILRESVRLKEKEKEKAWANSRARAKAKDLARRISKARAMPRATSKAKAKAVARRKDAIRAEDRISHPSALPDLPARPGRSLSGGQKLLKLRQSNASRC